MSHRFRCTALRSVLCLAVSVCACAAQTSASGAQNVSPEQQAALSAAQKDFAAQHWADALARLNALHAAAPKNVLVTKFDAEAALNAGQPAEAVRLLLPVVTAQPDDAQALAILAHAHAAQHQWHELDTSLKTLQSLHDAGKTRINQIPLGEDTLPDIGRVQWLYYLAPSWSRYNVYSMARILSTAGVVRERITLESGDPDQTLFAKQHPAEAAKGMREFTLDGYVNTDEHTQTHYTYAFFVGQPSFQTFREKVLAVTSGTLKPLSSRTNLPMPPSK